MKKITLIFALLLSASALVMAQPQLTWRFANYQVINAGAQLQFDVEVKADVSGTFHRDLQIYFDYNTAAFGSDIVLNGGISYVPLALMDDAAKYDVVNTADNTTSKFAIITEALEEMDEVGSSTHYIEVLTTYQGLLQFTMDISSGANNQLCGIAFDQALMDGGQYYQSTTVVEPVKYDASMYEGDISALKLSTLYGSITYDNGASTPLSDVTVTYNVYSEVTDASGVYNFSSIDDGVFPLVSSTTKAWGGISMNDVQLVRQYVTFQPPGNALTGLRLLAADVDQSTTVNMNDVQFMRQQVSGQAPGFTPFWIFEEPDATVSSGIGMQDLQGICAGDTDGSYIPPAK